MSAIENVILVNEQDDPLGVMEKIQAHRQGRLHRAFSVFIFNDNDELLMQLRSEKKYHSGGLWSNTCCSHPRPDEKNLEAANRRLKEEMGMTADLQYLYKFLYYAQLNDNMIEHEVDHIFVGWSNDIPQINKDEVSDWKYVSVADLESDIKLNPERYSVWFRKCFSKVIYKKNLFSEKQEGAAVASIY